MTLQAGLCQTCSKTTLLVFSHEGLYFVLYRYFKQQVSWAQSTIKIADEVPRDDNSTINAVYFTAGLEKLFKENQAEDSTLR